MSAAVDDVARSQEATADLRAVIEALRDEVRGLAQRLATLETQGHAVGAAGPAAAPERAADAAAASSTATAPRARPEVTEDDMVAIAAAVAAFLGVRAQIRQVRLVQSAAWAQVGRATIHASHRI